VQESYNNPIDSSGLESLFGHAMAIDGGVPMDE